MIRQIRLKNVRIFSGDWTFDMAPLTVLCGTNSAGKSTVLKSALLLRQSLGLDSSNAKAEGTLKLSGGLVDCGSYRSFVSENDEDQSLDIGVTMELRESRSFIKAVAAYAHDASFANTLALPKKGLVPYELHAGFSFLLNAVPTKKRERERVFQPDTREPQMASAAFAVTVGQESLLRWSLNTSTDTTSRRRGGTYDLAFPARYFEQVGGLRIMAIETSSEAEWIRVGAQARGLLPDNLIARMKQEEVEDGKDRRPPERWTTFPLPPQIVTILKSFNEALSGIHYLGPLRAPAERYYIAKIDSGTAVDPVGAFLPFALAKYADRKVWCALPGSLEPGEMEFELALDAWLHYMRTGEVSPSQRREVSVRLTRDVVVEFMIRGSVGKALHSLADSGFGYSQVLPILAGGLLTPFSETLIVEQPELHLNPALQVRLAYFFASMIRWGKQVVFETHSEHLVNAVRVMAAEDESGALANNTRVVFLDVLDGKPSSRALSVRADGTFDEWPVNFFGEALDLSGRLLRAQKNKMKRAPSEA